MERGTAEGQPNMIECCFPVSVVKSPDGKTAIVIDLPDAKNAPLEVRCQVLLDELKSLYPLLLDDNCNGTLNLSKKIVNMPIREPDLAIRFQNRQMYSCDTCNLEIDPGDYDQTQEKIISATLRLIDSVINGPADIKVPEKIKKALGI